MTITFKVELYGYDEIKCVMESNDEGVRHSVTMLKRIPIHGEYFIMYIRRVSYNITFQ